MKSYCVIEFKDKQEKVLVLNLLASGTEAEYKVTADLKKFVAEKFNVTILENDKECCHKTCETITCKDVTTNNIVDVQQSIDNNTDTLQAEQQHPVVVNNSQNSMNSQSSSIPVPSAVIDNSQNAIETKVATGFSSDNFVDVAPTRNDTLQNRQRSAQSSSVADSIVVDQPIPVIDNTQNLMNMEDYGTYVPYLERPVEPKEEIVEDVINMEGQEEELIGNNSVDNISNDSVLVLNKVDTPSSSTTRRSDRVAKKPIHLIDDDSDEEYEPPTKFSKNNTQSDGYEPKKATKEKTENCKKCGVEVKNRYSKKMDHIMTHSNIKRFECIVDDCGFKAGLRNYSSHHNRAKHPSQLNRFREIQLTPEQNTEIEKIIKECFDSSENNADKCQICWQSVNGSNHGNMLVHKQEHSINHLSFMIYKCMEDKCSFESKIERTMKVHAARSHEKRLRYQKMDLTADQKMEIEGIFSKCFPLMDDDESAP